MHRAGAMGFNATLRATHGGGCFSHIELFPVTQQEGFSLTGGQLLDRAFDYAKHLFLLQLRRWGFGNISFVIYLKCLQRVTIFIVVPALAGEA